LQVGALKVQTQGAAAQVTKYKRFQRSFELSEGQLWIWHGEVCCCGPDTDIRPNTLCSQCSYL